ncbi:hypothetical protein C8R45DRAFT_947005 [Mycena sanguinolenta]|nr:hypothetical protein C8R45DRAFT_947005 [Mycena sanguinolenta]
MNGMYGQSNRAGKPQVEGISPQTESGDHVQLNGLRKQNSSRTNNKTNSQEKLLSSQVSKTSKAPETNLNRGNFNSSRRDELTKLSKEIARFKESPHIYPQRQHSDASFRTNVLTKKTKGKDVSHVAGNGQVGMRLKYQVAVILHAITPRNAYQQQNFCIIVSLHLGADTEAPEKRDARLPRLSRSSGRTSAETAMVNGELDAGGAEMKNDSETEGEE